MWTCPNCGRSFRNAHQQHSCRLIAKESLFEKRPPLLRELYDNLWETVSAYGAVREETVPPDVIFLKGNSTFLAVKVKKAHLEVEFFLDHLENVPPVSKYVQTSARRVAHVVPVDRPEDLDAQLFAWIRSSWALTQNA